MSGNPNLQPVRKRKKHAPDRQQPEWLFPADSENPALKPHKEPTPKEKLEKQRSIDFLTRRAVGAPMNPPPPIQLLNLIGAFLAEYGFASTGRLFSTERQGRSKLDGWKDNTGEKLEKGMPTLGKIYKEWRKEWEERRLLEMTSSDEEDDAATKREKMLARKEKSEKKNNKAKDDATSSSGSSSSGHSSIEDSDAEMQDALPTKRSPFKKAKSSSGSSTSSTTSSDSDADDEKEVPAAKTIVQKPKPNNLKRKASPSSSSSSASESGSSSEDDAPKSKKGKASTDSPATKGVQLQNSSNKTTTKEAEQSSSESSSGSSSGSDSESSSNSMAKKTTLPASSESDSSSDSESDSSSDNDKKNKTLTSSDTSATLSDGPKKLSPVNSEDSSSNNSTTKSNVRATTMKGKLGNKSPATPATQLPRKTNIPFSRIPKDIKVDEKLASNAYVPYDYAQKAHEDLIVTKGKNFTKEKNKKKRGSYKGGYIDVDGKKGIKFDD
jgi:hypothetical protein